MASEHSFYSPDRETGEASGDQVVLTRVDDVYSYDHPDPMYKHDFDTALYGHSETMPNHAEVEDFESEIDHIIGQSADTDLHSLIVENTELPELPRTDTPTRGGPRSVFNDSESAYGSAYTYSQYSSNYQLASPGSHYLPSPADLAEIDISMERLGIRSFGPSSAYGGALSALPVDLSPSLGFSSNHFHRSAVSEYEPAVSLQIPSSSMSDYHPTTVPIIRQPTISPLSVSSQVPQSAATPVLSGSPSPLKLKGEVAESATADSERRFQCPSCPRAFSRRYNLKTHIDTHDVNRVKHFMCEKESCGKAFSRKNDLKRHMKALHRPDTPTSSVHSVGVGGGHRSRCDKCGRSWIGKDANCNCKDVK